MFCYRVVRCYPLWASCFMRIHQAILYSVISATKLISFMPVRVGFRNNTTGCKKNVAFSTAVIKVEQRSNLEFTQQPHTPRSYFEGWGIIAARAWWRHQMETFSALLAICAGNSPVPPQRPVTRSFDVFFDKRLSKQSWGWWFETLSRPLWRHCNVVCVCVLPRMEPILQRLCEHINSSPLNKMAATLADDKFRCIFLNGSDRIPIRFPLKFVRRSPIYNKPALVQMMAWRWIGDKPLSEPMLAQITDAYMRY